MPLGVLADRLGRSLVMLAGMGVQLGGSLLVALTGDYWSVTAGTVFVGLGWSCVNVAAAALIADTTQPEERGRAIGANDTFSSGASMVMPVMAGPIVALAGLPSLALVSALVLSVPTYLLTRLVETSPGKYRDTPAS
jgi:MFS family permease